MNKNIYLLFVLSVWIVLQLGCDKDNNGLNQHVDIVGFDTIYPLSYLPVFPGSYWIYRNDDGSLDTSFTSNEYILDYYEYGSAGYISDTFYVPKLDNVPIWGYEAHTGPISHGGSYPFTIILKDTVDEGYNWVIAYWAGNENRRQIVAKDKVITLSTGYEFDSVIIVKEYQSIPDIVPGWWYKRFYAKGVGMIKEEYWFSYDSTYKNKELIDYKINEK